MRIELKVKATISAIFLQIGILFLALNPAFAAAETDICEREGWKPVLAESDEKSLCRDSTSSWPDCQKSFDTIRERNKNFEDRWAAECNGALLVSKEKHTQASAITEQKVKLGKIEKGAEVLTEWSKNMQEKTLKESEPHLEKLKNIGGPLATKQPAKPYGEVREISTKLKRIIEPAKKNPASVEGKLAKSGLSGRSLDKLSGDKEAKARAGFLLQSTSFLEALVYAEKSSEQLGRAMEQARKNLPATPDSPAGPETPGNPGGGPSGVSGGPLNDLPLGALASLAGPAMAMMNANKKTPDASDLDLPDPAASTAPEPVPGTKLSAGEKKPIGDKKEDIADPKKEEEDPSPFFGTPLSAYESGDSAKSDITTGQGRGLAKGGGSTGVSTAGGAGGSSGASNNEEPKNLKAGGEILKLDDSGLIPEMGGGSSYAAGGDSGSESAVPTEEGAGMTEVLSDMESAIDNGTALWDENGGPSSEQAEAGVGGEDSQNLFLRVRTCVVRNLKKGSVHNGMGERLDEI